MIISFCFCFENGGIAVWQVFFSKLHTLPVRHAQSIQQLPLLFSELEQIESPQTFSIVKFKLNPGVNFSSFCNCGFVFEQFVPEQF